MQPDMNDQYLLNAVYAELYQYAIFANFEKKTVHHSVAINNVNARTCAIVLKVLVFRHFSYSSIQVVTSL